MAKSPRRRKLRILLFSLLALAVLVACAPWLTRLGVVRRLIESQAGAWLGREVVFAEVDAGWLDGVSLTGVRIANDPDAEFDTEPLLEARRIDVTDSLAGLILRDRPSQVRIDGLRLRIEERAGGRTNIDELLARTAPRPKVPPLRPVTKRPPPPRPLRVELTDARITLRRLAYRPPDEPLDPFKSDLAIRPASEGLVEARLEGLDLVLESGPDGQHVRFEGRAFLAGSEGGVEGDLRRAPGGRIEGRARASGLDLALLRPWLGGGLAGRIDFDLAADDTGLTLEAGVAGLNAFGLKEERVDVVLAVERRAGGWFAREASLETASDRIMVRGSGPFGCDGEFKAEAHLPVAPLLELRGPAPLEGILRLEGSGRCKGRTIAGEVQATLTHARLLGTGDRRSGPTNVTLDLEADFARDTRELEIHRLHAVSPEFGLELSGRARAGAPAAFDLSGSGRVEFEALRRVVEPLLDLDPGLALRGRAVLDRLAVRSKAPSRFHIGTQAVLEDFALSGALAEPLERKHATLVFEAGYDADLDRLDVARAKLDELEAAGTVEGLLAGGTPRVDGRVRGRIALDPALARLVRIEDLAELKGDVTLDVAAARDDAGWKSVAADVAVDGFVVAGPFGRVEQPRLELHAEGSGRDGTFTLEGREFEADGAYRALEPTRLHVQVADTAALPRLVPRLALPERLALGGPVEVALDLTRPGGRWRAEGRVDSPALTLLWDGRGLVQEPFSTRLKVRRLEYGWAATLADGLLARREAAFSVERAEYRDDGSWRLVSTLEAPLGRVPELERYEAAGHVQAHVELEAASPLRFRAKLVGTDTAFVLDGRRLTPGRVVIDASGTPAGGGARFDDLLVDAGGVRLRGEGTVGRDATLALTAEGDLESLRRYLPGLVDGRGPFRVKADVACVLKGRGEPFRASGSFSAPAWRGYGLDVSASSGEFALEGLGRPDTWDELSTTLLARARRVAWSDVTLLDAEIQQTGRGAAGRGFGFRVQVDASRMVADELPFERVQLAGRGRMRDPFRPRREELRLDGTLRFGSFTAGDVVWTQGSARIAADADTVRVTELRSDVNGGVVTGDATLRHGTAPLDWRTRLSVRDVRLSEKLGRPLSLIVPILRLSGRRAERRLSGLLDGEVSFSGRGTSSQAMQRSLRGSGKLRFRRVEVRGSLLLPLLSLRLDRALEGRPFSFADLDVRFEVRDGKVRPAPFRLEGRPFSIRIEGEAGLDGTVNFLVSPSLLPIPLRVKGPIEKPKVRPAPLGGLRLPGRR